MGALRNYFPGPARYECLVCDRPCETRDADLWDRGLCPAHDAERAAIWPGGGYFHVAECGGCAGRFLCGPARWERHLCGRCDPPISAARVTGERPVGRPRAFTSNAERQKAYRARQREKARA